jgi:hypothetical protein
MTNPKVHVALADIGGHLTYKKADVRFAYLPEGENSAKARARRLSCRGGTIDALITSAVLQPREPRRPNPPAAATPVATMPRWQDDAAALLPLFEINGARLAVRHRRGDGRRIIDVAALPGRTAGGLVARDQAVPAGPASLGDPLDDTALAPLVGDADPHRPMPGTGAPLAPGDARTAGRQGFSPLPVSETRHCAGGARRRSDGSGRRGAFASSYRHLPAHGGGRTSHYVNVVNLMTRWIAAIRNLDVWRVRADRSR